MAVHLMLLRQNLAGNNLGGGTDRAARRGNPPPLLGNRILPTHPPINITGVTRDNLGAVLGECDVELYARAWNLPGAAFVAGVVSDGSGLFSFRVSLGQQYQHIAYKVGTPDVAGVSLRDLQGV